MLVDNCAAHSNDVRMTNVKLVFLPPNTASLIQPMDQGIIANFKRHYRSLVVRHLMATIDESSDASMRVTDLTKKLTMLDSLHMQNEAWSRITAQTISNCYRRANFIKETTDDVNEPDTNQTDTTGGYRSIRQLTNSVTRRFGDKAGQFGERLG